MDTTNGSAMALRDTGVSFVDHDRDWAMPEPEDRSAPSPEVPARARRDRCTRGLSSNAIRRVQAFLDSHIGESFTLADIAAAACISRFHFARMFRLSLGKSPMEYALGLRIAQAKTMLLQSDLKISTIAATLGFCDQSHFTRSFRRVTGTSPRQFARMHAARERPHQ